MKYFTSTSILFFILFFTGCSPKYHGFNNSKAVTTKMEFKDLNSFLEDDLEKALIIFQKACKRSSKKKIFKNVCKKSFETKDAKEFFTKNFTPYKLLNKDKKDEGVITGYYEPLLYGSYKKSEKYPYPVYGVPKDLLIVKLSKFSKKFKNQKIKGMIKNNEFVPYNTRAEINKRDDIKNILCYVNSKENLFFLQIQGSGRVQLDSGELINLSYANQNGRKYKSVGKYMISKGYIGNGIDASMQGMKKWFRANPSLTDKTLNHNESFVFFAKSKKAATGSLGVELVGKRNIAVDTSYIPLGMPVFIQTRNPITKERINKIMVAADTGGAIKGDIRADFFYGFGQEAEDLAGRMKEKGKLIMLVPNNLSSKEL